MSSSKNVTVTATLPWTRIALFAIGGYLLWRNRFKIQETLEANGISTPWMNSSIGEAVQSGAAKLGGSLRNSVRNDFEHSETI